MDTRQRDTTLDELEKHEFDLVVIGGGITGAGVLREAALRGLSVALLEAGDFGSGTSSKSTKLIHGGIRYLAMGHVHVVREAARERKRVHLLAPHLAEPMSLILPAHNILQHLKYRTGVTVYEYLGQVDAADRHFNLGGEDLNRREPLLDTEAFPWACIYREYLTDDARLVLANVRAGIAAGGRAVNYVRVEGLVKDHARVTGVRARDVSGREILVRARGVINAAGPWVESICEQDGLATPKPMVLSKGIHIVVNRERLTINHPIMMVSKDSRPVFAIPRGDIVYIGTTDTRYPGSADHWPRVEQDEVKYLFEPVERYFGVRLRLSDVRMTWAGLRPLILERGKSTRDISRKDEVWISKSGLITIAGGKLTGYRKMAEDTVSRAVDRLGLKARAPAEDVPLPGGESAVNIDGLEGPDVRLARLYGSERDRVIACGGMPLVEHGMVRSGEIIWAIRQEGALTLEDVLYRRTRAALYRPDEALVAVDPASRLMAAELGWDETTRLDEVRRVRKRLLTDSEFIKVREIDG